MVCNIYNNKKIIAYIKEKTLIYITLHLSFTQMCMRDFSYCVSFFLWRSRKYMREEVENI